MGEIDVQETVAARPGVLVAGELVALIVQLVQLDKDVVNPAVKPVQIVFVSSQTPASKSVCESRVPALKFAAGASVTPDFIFLTSRLLSQVVMRLEPEMNGST